MLSKVFVDAHGYLWFKQDKRKVWLDHPDPSLAMRARCDKNGHPQLAGQNLKGEMISEIDSNIAVSVVKAIFGLNLPQYLLLALERRFEAVWEHIKGEFESLIQVYQVAGCH